MSVVLRELDEMLPLAAAVAVADAVPGEAAIKWPNDVWIDGKKLAGILVEGRPQEGWAVLGIGLNVTTEKFPAELAETATSLRLAGIEEPTEAALARRSCARSTNGLARRPRVCSRRGASGMR